MKTLVRAFFSSSIVSRRPLGEQEWPSLAEFQTHYDNLKPEQWPEVMRVECFIDGKWKLYAEYEDGVKISG